ncbi:DUF86 domain-containing protein [Methanoculleus sp.]|jgi:uncharacterized protein with HEPN domain|uniref:HepT-like ribonuclease domain-containing protein n=1 Tax=Methanoculleus sp. TaxID=90427 RepID=UPI000B2AF87D|nr:DUF86 domain-containing protein [Methanoculleus sp.]HNT09068.1 DUF86 domain-containing protein [Methanoculleus sp.]
MTRLRSYLTDIYEQSENIMKATGRMSYEEFLEDALYNAGIIRFFEIIGEAAKHVPDDFRSEHPGIPWRKISGLRDRLIHDYPGVNLKYVWTLATVEIPVLHRQIGEILGDQE